MQATTDMAKPPLPRLEPPIQGGPFAPRAADQDIIPEGSLLAVVRRIARKWWLILGVTMVATVTAYFWMVSTAPQYTARTIVTAAESSSDKLGGAFSSLSFGASQLGIDLGGTQSAPNFTEFLEVLTSLTLAERLDQRYGVLRKVFGSRWDAKTGTWKPPGGLLGRLQSNLRSLVGQKPWAEPSTSSLAGFLTKELRVIDADGTGIFLIEFSHNDPEFARTLLAQVLEEADNIIKERTIARSQEQIAYLQVKLNETSLREQRTSLLGLLLLEERSVLLASSDLPFAAKFVDKVAVSELPTFPNPMQIFTMAIFGGIAVTILGILVVDVVRYA